jgi:hypothetical protein
MDANKLYQETKHLATKINGFYQLPPFDRDIAITNSFMAIWKKMEEGKVSSTDYNDYKGYLFITIKTNINLYFRNIKLLKNANEINMVEGINYDICSEENDCIYNLDLEDKIKSLKKKEKMVLQMKIDGYTRQEIAEELDYGYNWVSSKLTHIKNKLK